MPEGERKVTAGLVTVNASSGTVQFSNDLEIDGEPLTEPWSDEEYRILMRWAADELEDVIRAMNEAGGAQQLIEERGAGRL